jgi:hypothetical protein
MNRNAVVLCVVRFALGLTLTTVGATYVSAQVQDLEESRALALWEEAIHAKGGRQRLQSIQNFLISSQINTHTPGKIAVTTHTTEMERLYVMPNKAWIYEWTQNFGITLEAKLINFDYNFCAVTLAPAPAGVPTLSLCIPTTPFEYLVQQPAIYLMETKWVRPVPKRVRVEGKGRWQVEVIETQIGKIRADYYLDRKTKLPYKIVTNQLNGIWETDHLKEPLGSLPYYSVMTIELHNYKEIDGILMPQRVTQIEELSNTIERRLHIEDARYRFNVSYNPAIFHDPIPKDVKRHDWKLVR